MPTLQQASVHAKAPKGGVQAWSVGATYPITVVGIMGPDFVVRWRAENLHTGEQGPERAEYAQAELDEHILYVRHVAILR